MSVETSERGALRLTVSPPERPATIQGELVLPTGLRRGGLLRERFDVLLGAVVDLEVSAHLPDVPDFDLVVLGESGVEAPVGGYGTEVQFLLPAPARGASIEHLLDLTPPGQC
jgi:hypothetical protein